MKVVRTSQILILIGVLTCQNVQAAEERLDVDAAWSQSSSLESSGDFLKAANILRPVADTYDQDFQSQIQVAWLYFQGGAFDDALIYYRRADAVAGSPGLARLGMGWSFLKLEQRALARQAFTEYLDANPDNPQSALEGLALAQDAPVAQNAPQSWAVVVTATPLAVQEYFDNPERESGLGAEFGLGATFGRLSINAAYTYHRFELNTRGSTTAQALSGTRNMGSNNSSNPNNTGGLNNTVNNVSGTTNGASNSPSSTYIEHSVFGSMGLSGTRFGASVDGALATNTRKISDWAAGGTLRLSGRNHLRVGGLYGEVQRAELIQGNISYDILLYDSWWLTPAGVMQFPPDTDITGAGKLELSHRGPLTVFVSGRYGRTFHEVDLIAPAISSNDDDVIWGAATGISSRIGNVWGVGTTLAWEHYEQHTSGEPSDGFFGKVFLNMYLGGE